MQTRSLPKPPKTLLLPQVPDHPILPLLRASDPRAAHALALTSGFIRNAFAASRLLQLLLRRRRSADNGDLLYAAAVFDSLPSPDLYTWNALIAAHADRRLPRGASAFYFRMRAAGARPTAYTLALLVKACVLGCSDGGLGGLGEQVHGQVLKCGVEDAVVVRNSLLKMYCDMGRLEEARQLFEESSSLDCISWNTMISAYGKNGCVGTARELFDSMPERSLVSWSALIDGYVRNGDFTEALLMFNLMQGNHVKPDAVTLVGALKACAQLGALDQGRWIHLFVDRHGIRQEGNVILDTALIDMYCKCGGLDEALVVFNSVCIEDVILWNAMIAGLAMHGHGDQAVDLFHSMRGKGLLPTGSTFVGVLCACSHIGRVDDGREIFKSMEQYGVVAQREHYGCLADLLGRAGLVEEAEELLLEMPMEPHAAQWGALMSACRMHNNVEVGERVGKHLIALEPYDGGRYVLLANIYAANGRWDDVKDMRRAMEEKGVKKETGCSFIEWNGTVHEFIVGDISHPQSREIYALLEEIEKKLERIGYVKDTTQLLLDMGDEEEKGNALSYHSEKLALAFGLINIGDGLPIRVVKNLRVCRDCHNYAKLVSKLCGREILMRDRHRFHKFKQGLCSCNDYW